MFDLKCLKWDLWFGFFNWCAVKINALFECLHNTEYLTQTPKTVLQLERSLNHGICMSKQCSSVVSIISVDIMPHVPLSHLYLWWFESINKLALTSWWTATPKWDGVSIIHKWAAGSRPWLWTIVLLAPMSQPRVASVGFNYTWLPAVALQGPLIE